MAIELRQPATITDPESTWQNESQINDNPTIGGDTTTYGDCAGNLAGNQTYTGWLVMTAFPAAVETYTALTLNAKWGTNDETGDDQWSLEYSTDGGSVWGNWLLTLAANRSTSAVDSQVSLAIDQDLTNLQVRLNTTRVAGGDGDTVAIFDIWTEGTYTEGGTTLEIDVSDCQKITTQLI